MKFLLGVKLILFGLKISSEYKYHYSVSTIWIIFVHLWLPSKHFVPIIELVSFSLNWTWNRIGQVSWIRQKDLHILTVGETSYTNNLKFFPTHPPGRWLSTSNIHKVILPIELLDIQAFWYHYDITKSGIPTNREKFTVYTFQIKKNIEKNEIQRAKM